MEKKKSARSNLEPKRMLFLEMGLIIVLAMVLYAFEYKSYDAVNYSTADLYGDKTPDDLTPITVQKERPLPPKPIPPSLNLNIVDDKVEVINTIDIVDIFDDGAPIDDYVYKEDIVDIPEDVPFVRVENMPEFKGGLKAMYAFINSIIEYPRLAKEIGISGRVFLSFVVERDGSITDVQITRGIGGGCDEEAVRVIKAMPNWNPGKQRENPVRVQYQMAIKFSLQ